MNWNSGDRLRRCLQSLPAGFEVVVVDNASDDWDRVGVSGHPITRNEAVPLDGHESPFMKIDNLSSCFSRAPQVIRNKRNEGFAVGANQGASGCCREYLLFLNPDVWFESAASADPMLLLLKEQLNVAAATGRFIPPKSISSEWRIGPFPDLIRPLPTLWSALADILFLDELSRKQKPRLSDMTPIEQAPGACLLIRRSVFEELGGFDSRFYPAWFEDVDLCKRIRERGLQICWQPRSLFYHEGGYSAGQMSGAEFNRIFYGNMVRYFAKHHSATATAILRVAVPLGNVARRLLRSFGHRAGGAEG
ncbi:MAG TPA: glycosyltransferase family 2 protein [Acidobacteriota bacterium]|nr:glycosyltransferase family 2 protein [Acidobacteriota bacterium]